MREITLDTAKGKDLLKPYPFIGLIPATMSEVYRPHSSSASGRCAPSDTFPPGEGIAAYGRCRPNRATNSIFNSTIN